MLLPSAVCSRVMLWTGSLETFLFICCSTRSHMSGDSKHYTHCRDNNKAHKTLTTQISDSRHSYKLTELSNCQFKRLRWSSGSVLAFGTQVHGLFAGSNPTEAVGFFRVKKSSAHPPSEGK